MFYNSFLGIPPLLRNEMTHGQIGCVFKLYILYMCAIYITAKLFTFEVCEAI